jgi:hypothetical protein
MSRIDSLTQIRVRLTHVTAQVSPTSLERIRQAWAGVPMHRLPSVSFARQPEREPRDPQQSKLKDSLFKRQVWSTPHSFPNAVGVRSKRCKHDLSFVWWRLCMLWLQKHSPEHENRVQEIFPIRMDCFHTKQDKLDF